MIDPNAFAIPIGTLIIAGAAVFVSGRSVRQTAEANAFNAVLSELNLERQHSDRQDAAIKGLQDEVGALKQTVAKCERERTEDREAHQRELLLLYRKINALEEGKTQ